MTELEREAEKSASIRSFIKKQEAGKIDQQDISLYGADLGECIGKIVTDIKDPSMGWTEYYGRVLPLFKEAHAKVMAAAESLQKDSDKKDGISIKPVIPAFPENKIRDLIYKIYEDMRNG